MTTHKTSAFFYPRILLAFVICSLGLLMALLGLGAFSTLHAQPRTATPVSKTAETPAPGEQLSPADKQGRFVYLVQFIEPGVLRRQEHVSGEQFNPNSQEAKSKLAEVQAEQAAYVQAMDRALGRSVQPTHYFLVTHSGLAARMTPGEAEIVRKLPGVASVERERLYNLDTHLGPILIGAPSIWDGSAVPGGMAINGRGIVIGMLDSGVDPNHPSYANVASCGHGVAGAPDKLISYLDCASATGPGGLCNGPSPVDVNGHGSHTASTSGGNTVDASAVPPPTPPAPYTQISGVAPCANLRSYKVCPGSTCPQADIQAGMNSILLHGDVKVMNFSISGGNDPWNDNDRRKLDLVDAGVLVAASAGNTSATITDPVGNVAHLGPWVMTVAASTRGGDASGLLSASGPGTPPAGTQNIAATKGNASPVGNTLTNAPMRHYTAQALTSEGCTADPNPFPAGFFNGAVALIHRGGCTFTEKITNAFNAGAMTVIIRNNQATALSMATPGQPNVPAYSIDQTSGNALVAFVDANPTTATVNFQILPVPPDTLANFTLRGPSAIPSLTKPDITGPGVSIYAAAPLDITPAGYAYLSGTSMSSPHAAGSAALVRLARPTWNPTEVKSAMMMTAYKNGKKENQVTPWDADDVGNGRIDLTKAAKAGLVMSETFARFLAADPATGGDPKTLNIASARNTNCVPSCSWTRTVRNTLTTPSSWLADGNAITPGFRINVQPRSFSFTGNLSETRQLTITATPTSNLTSAIAFGEVNLIETGSRSPTETITVAIKGEPFIVSAVSRKSHGAAGTFDIPLPLTGTPGLESRSTGGIYTIVVTFTDPTSVGSATVTGVGSASVSTAGSVATVTLTGVTDGQRLVVNLNNANNGRTTTNLAIPINILAADINANGAVSSSDVAQAKGQSGLPVTASNFRNDVNGDGVITSSDVTLVKSRSGSSLP